MLNVPTPTNKPIIDAIIAIGNIDPIVIIPFPEYIKVTTNNDGNIVVTTDFFFIPKYNGINAVIDRNYLVNTFLYLSCISTLVTI